MHGGRGLHKPSPGTRHRPRAPLLTQQASPALTQTGGPRQRGSSCPALADLPHTAAGRTGSCLGGQEHGLGVRSPSGKCQPPSPGFRGTEAVKSADAGATDLSVTSLCCSATPPAPPLGSLPGGPSPRAPRRGLRTPQTAPGEGKRLQRVLAASVGATAGALRPHGHPEGCATPQSPHPLPPRGPLSAMSSHSPTFCLPPPGFSEVISLRPPNCPAWR